MVPRDVLLRAPIINTHQFKRAFGPCFAIVWYTDRTNGTDRTDRNLLKVIYLEHGPPLVIQSDQGREFKGAVEKLCREMKIKQSPLPPTISRESGKKPPFLA